MPKGFKFTDNSKKVMKSLEKASEKGVTAACLVVEAQAKALVSSKGGTGQLRDSITHKVKNSRGEVVGEVGTPVDYAVYQEFGTGEFAEKGDGRKGGWSYQDANGDWYYTIGNRPRPFLRPAFRENKQNIINILKKDIANGVGK